MTRILIGRKGSAPTIAQTRESKGKVVFVQLHQCYRSLREEAVYQDFIASRPDLANLWIAELDLKWSRTFSALVRQQASDVVKLRSLRQLASPLFLRFCDQERLDPVVTADSILPEAVLPLPGDGHPWLATDTPQHRHAITMQKDILWPPPPRQVLIRRRDDARGAASAVQNDDTIDLSVEIGGATLRTERGSAVLTVPKHLPETIAVACVGRRVDVLVEHSLLVGPENIISEVRTARDGRKPTAILFDCPSVPFTAVRPAKALPGPELHTDPTLGGPAAVADMLARMARINRKGYGQPSANVLLRDARLRTERINLGRPAATRLPVPTEAQVRRAISELP